MIYPKSTPTSKPLHEQLAPGGYLHDGTSDTQIFGFSESQSRSARHVASPPSPPCPDDVETKLIECRGYSQGDTANPDDPASELHLNLYQRHFARNPIAPALLASLESPAPELPLSSPKHSRALESSTSPPPKRQRLEAVSPNIRETGKIPVPMSPATAVHDAKELRVERLAHLLSSADYANAEDADTFPLLKRFGGIRSYEGILSPETIQKLMDDEIAFITQFYEACWQSRPPHAHRSHIAFCNDPNAVQREYLVLFIQLTKHMPLLIHTVMDPDRADTMSLIIASMGRIIHAMQILAKVRSQAQNEIAIAPLD
ncbi:hypothetical protein C8R44DRAFT_741960 [Mycena epipterygia]|nr:hypothetical protein C8R44DRAFT_741960 [Mycena epipterygia]